MFDQKFIDSQKGKLEKSKAGILRQIQLLVEDDSFSDLERLDDNATVDAEAREQETHLRVEAEIDELKAKLVDVERALEKIIAGKYGYDEKTGLPIKKQRLELIPEARFDI